MKKILILVFSLVAWSQSTAADISLSQSVTPETTAATRGTEILIGSVTATGFGGGVAFSVTPLSIWRIDNSGQLYRAARTSDDIDFEALPLINKTLIATVTAMKGAVTVTKDFPITITNVNEVPTALTISNSSCNEETNGATIGTLNSFDPDSGDHANYSVPFGSGYRIIGIDGNILALSDDKRLNYESNEILGNYAARTVVVTVTDNGGLSTTLTVNVTPTNVNEPPTNLAIDNNSCLEEVFGATIGVLTSSDPDGGDTARYSVPVGSGYWIDGTTLKLTPDKRLDYENSSERDSYAKRSVTVTVTDRDGLFTTLTVSVVPTNVNEAPTVVRFASDGNVNENEVAASIGELATIDPDGDQTFDYELVDPTGLFTLSGSRLRLKPGVAVNFEATPTLSVSVKSTDGGKLFCITPLTVTVNDMDEAPTLPRWTTVNAEVINAALAVPVSTVADVVVDEDTDLTKRNYHNMTVTVSIDLSLNPQATNDVLSVLSKIPADFLSEMRINTSSRLIFRRAGGVSTQIATYSQSANSVAFTFTGDSAIPLDQIDLARVIRLVGYTPGAADLDARTAVVIDLSFNNAPPTRRTISLDTANLPPSLTDDQTIGVTRFSQVALTPTNLGLSDEHPELGLTLFIDYPPLNGELRTAGGSRVLGPDESVPVIYTAPVLPATVGTLSIDLVYVPRATSAAVKDTCFLSIQDKGAKITATLASWLRSTPTKFAFDIAQGAFPVVITTGSLAYTEGTAPIPLVAGGATLNVAGITNTDTATIGGWDLYIACTTKRPNQGPGNAHEIIAVTPNATITLGVDGRSIIRGGRTIGQIDSILRGSESSLVIRLANDALGADILALAKALTYVDTSERLPLTISDPLATRTLYLGFVLKGADLSAPALTELADIALPVSRNGIDDPPTFSEGSRRTLITVSNEILTGSTILEDLDTNTVPTLSMSGLSTQAQPQILRGPEDTGSTWRTTIAWQLARDPNRSGDQEFLLTAVIGGTTLSQTIVLSPRSGSDLSLAIASDAPLALVKPAATAAPLKRAVRVRRGMTAVSDTTIYLLGQNIPAWITVDSTASTVSYDLANPQAVAGQTYRFSILATTANSAAEQPVVLRIVGQPLTGTN